MEVAARKKYRKSVGAYNPQYNFKNVEVILQQGVDQSVFPGAVLLVGCNGEVVHSNAVGDFYYATENVVPDKVELDTVYDIGNLSTVIATTTIIMKLAEEGRLSLDDKVTRYIQSFSVNAKSKISIRDLLRHTSGLAAWQPYYEELLKENSGSHMGILATRGARDYIYNKVNRSQLKYETGKSQLYSDLGFILLGSIIESLTGVSLDRAMQKYVFYPLGMKNSSYVDLALARRRGLMPVKEMIAPTEECSWRKKLLWGEVHDDNAWAMGGIAGHAGVFSNVKDLHILCDTLLQAINSRSSFLRTDTVSEFWFSNKEYAKFALGWEKATSENSMNETGLSSSAVGFNGFSGCTVWLEPESGFDIILLCNRICPSRNNKKINSFRPVLLKTVLDCL